MTLDTNDDYDPLTPDDAGEENEVLRAVRQQKHQQQAAEEGEVEPGIQRRHGVPPYRCV